MLTIHHLKKTYAGQDGRQDFVLAASNIRLRPGRIATLLGRNGSGKSTLIKTLLGVVSPDEISLELDIPEEQFRAELGCLLEGGDFLYPFLNPMQNARYFCALHGKTADEAYLRDLLEALDLLEYQRVPVRKLSTGNRRKSSLLCCLAHRPSYLLLDEPTLGLDLAAIERIIGTLRDYSCDAVVLVTSHDADFVRRTTEDLFYIERGLLEGSLDAANVEACIEQLRGADAVTVAG